MSTKILQLNNIRQLMFRVVLISFLLFVFLYLYFVSSIIVNVIETKEIRKETRTLNASVAELEQDYLLRNTVINLELGQKLGFKEPENTNFATREVLVTSSILGINEI